MFNLLPDNLKEKVKAEYRLRYFSVVLTFVLFIQVSFLIFLLPSWLVSFYKEKEVVLETEQIKQSALASDANLVTSTVQSINTKLNIINSKLEYPKAIPFIDIILAKKTGEIFINELTYIVNSSAAGKITVSGLSATRESLVAFVKSLQDSNVFKSVDLPISNFAKDKNINFSLNITIAP